MLEYDYFFVILIISLCHDSRVSLKTPETRRDRSKTTTWLGCFFLYLPTMIRKDTKKPLHRKNVVVRSPSIIGHCALQFSQSLCHSLWVFGLIQRNRHGDCSSSFLELTHGDQSRRLRGPESSRQRRHRRHLHQASRYSKRAETRRDRSIITTWLGCFFFMTVRSEYHSHRSP